MSLYQTLGIEASATPAEVKKAYRKLCLKYHPDKQGEDTREKAKEKFQEISAAYAILGDPNRRKKYDETGSTDDSVEIDIGWLEAFRAGRDPITGAEIEEDRKNYQGSTEEYEDICNAFEFYNGDFLQLFEVVPHLELTLELEQRVYDLITKAIDEKKVLGDFTKWKRYTKNRPKQAKAKIRKLEKEAKEAEVLQKELNIKMGGEDELGALIRKRHASLFDNLISSLERKYGGVTKEKKGKKTKKSKKQSAELDDAVFEAAQMKMMESRK